MSLYYPDSAEDVDLSKPQLHALVIGVGEYLHIGGVNAHPAVRGFGLKPLTCTPITARSMAEWLEHRYSNPDCPLGTVEILLSPGGSMPQQGREECEVEPATMENIRSAFRRWWERCTSHKQNIALFYFAGHGISAGTSLILLPSDFGASGPNLWENCIDFSGMRLGMDANAASTQLFFADACRESLMDVLVQRNPSGDALCSTDVFADRRNVGTYYAAADDRTAHGPDNDVTYFGRAVIESLDGGGARRHNGEWVVDTFALGEAISKIMDDLGKEARLTLTSSFTPSGQSTKVCLAESGAVRTTIGCKTRGANAKAEITLRRLTEMHFSKRGEERPWRGTLSPGDWDINVDFADAFPFAHQDTILPPTYTLEVDR